MISRPEGYLQCLRCGHEWLQRGVMPPRQCPNCKNPKWNIERKATTEEKVQAAYEKAGVRKPLVPSPHVEKYAAGGGDPGPIEVETIEERLRRKLGPVVFHKTPEQDLRHQPGCKCLTCMEKK